jgi:DNA-binding NtrC family response regulator
MLKTRVLVVDDEKNIRLGLTQVVESMGLPVAEAATGAEALGKLAAEDFGLVLLDLKMPGMAGMEVLRRMRATHSHVRVIIITAYGTVESAVEAMKLGAVDFIQKPFSPREMRALISKVLEREALQPDQGADCSAQIELAKRSIGRQEFGAAMDHVRKAIALDPKKAEAFNLLGALEEIAGDPLSALRDYRAATALDPTYKPPYANMKRLTSREKSGDIVIGDKK